MRTYDKIQKALKKHTQNAQKVHKNHTGVLQARDCRFEERRAVGHLPVRGYQYSVFGLFR